MQSWYGYSTLHLVLIEKQKTHIIISIQIISYRNVTVRLRNVSNHLNNLSISTIAHTNLYRYLQTIVKLSINFLLKLILQFNIANYRNGALIYHCESIVHPLKYQVHTIIVLEVRAIKNNMYEMGNKSRSLQVISSKNTPSVSKYLIQGLNCIYQPLSMMQFWF